MGRMVTRCRYIVRIFWAEQMPPTILKVYLKRKNDDWIPPINTFFNCGFCHNFNCLFTIGAYNLYEIWLLLDMIEQVI